MRHLRAGHRHDGSERVHQRLALRSIPFYVVVVLLVAFFVYYWQNHRIRIIYSPFIFTRPGFVQASRKLRHKTILVQMSLSKVITALLPICLVILYLFAFLLHGGPERSPRRSEERPPRRLRPVLPHAGRARRDPEHRPPGGAVPHRGDTLLFIGGVSTAFVITLVLLVLISKWSTLAIVVPLQGAAAQRHAHRAAGTSPT